MILIFSNNCLIHILTILVRIYYQINSKIMDEYEQHEKIINDALTKYKKSIIAAI